MKKVVLNLGVTVEFLKICIETSMPKRHHNQKLLKSIQ